MDLNKILTDLLPIAPPFFVERLEKRESELEVHIYLGVDASMPPPNSSIHSYYQSAWEHLKLFQYRCFIHCQLPVYKDKSTGKFTKAQVNFARDYSRFTLPYEQEAMRWMKIHRCFSAVAKNSGIRIQRVESIYRYYTKSYETNLTAHTPTNIAVDETSTRKGREYITTFVDRDTKQIIGIYDGKSSACIEEFVQDHPNPETIKNISLDRSPAFIGGVKTYRPTSQTTFDKWHAVKLLHKHLADLGERSQFFSEQIRLLPGRITDFYRRRSLQRACRTTTICCRFCPGAAT